MTQEHLPPYQSVIEDDVANGTGATFDRFIADFKAKTGANKDFFADVPEGQQRSDLTQIDVVADNSIYRLDLLRTPTLRCISVWNVDGEGSPTSDMLSYSHGADDKKTFISGSSLGSWDGGDMLVTPVELGDMLEFVVDHLTPDHWKVIVPSEPDSVQDR